MHMGERNEREQPGDRKPLTAVELHLAMIGFYGATDDRDEGCHSIPDASPYPTHEGTGEVIYDLRPQNKGPVVVFVEGPTQE
jgi:hypothetical protein